MNQGKLSFRYHPGFYFQFITNQRRSMMKKMAFCVWGFGFVLLFVGFVHAQDGGMLNGQGVWKWDAGYAYQEIDMELTASSFVTDIDDWNNNMFKVPYDRDMYYVGASYGVCRWADLRVSFGFLDDEIRADGRTPSYNDHVNKGDGNWVWEIGLKTVLHTFRSGYYLGGTASYSQWDSGEDSYDIENTTLGEPKDYENEWTQWTAGIHVGKIWGKFSAWAGVEYVDMDMEQTLTYNDNSVRNHEYENKDEWGGALGVSYWVNPRFELTASGRLINQDAFSFGAVYKF